MGDFINSLSIVIVLYNTELDDSESFQSVIQMHKGIGELDLFVYDNSREPQQIKRYPNLHITYLHDPKNSGVSKAYNIGAENAQLQLKEWVLLLDQDTTLPQDIFDHYEKTIRDYPDIKLVVPILRLGNGKIFSPCSYKFKRGFYLDTIAPGLHSLNQLSPVNSGIFVHLTSFFEAGGYNEKVKLDFSDFQFIERFRKVYPVFYVMDVECQQDFSDDEVSYSGQLNRFGYYCEGARNSDKKGIWDWVQYNTVVVLRAMRLSVKYKKWGFINTYLNKFLIAPSISA